MGKESAELSLQHEAFIAKQSLFFVSTAPLASTGRVNVSPKGLDSFRVLSPSSVAYLDLTGSGNETAAHVTENGRITFLFCSFDREPMILRLYGQGRAVLPGSDEFGRLISQFEAHPGVRQLIVVNLSSVKTSCGYGIPMMHVVNERDTLVRWAESKGADELVAYRQANNTVSMDGIPAPSRNYG